MSIISKKVVLVIVLLVIICFTSYALASYSPRLSGKPEAYHPGSCLGYFIWQDNDGLHLRTASPETKHVFSGSVRTNGIFEDTFEKSPRDGDSFHVNEGRDKITFQFTNIGDTAGIDLHVTDGTYVTFNLSMDGDPIDPDLIFIGGDGWHPGTHKFTFRHDGDPQNYSDDQSIIIIGGPSWWWYDWNPIFDPGPGPNHNTFREPVALCQPVHQMHNRREFRLQVSLSSFQPPITLLVYSNCL
ncbi:MAG: hypothetical protein H6Q67_1388 [Firmicutes bacterium]|nr:hypothetical protein [Bacillota bacterium]